MKQIMAALCCTLLLISYAICSSTSDTVYKDDLHRYFWAEYQRFGGNGEKAYEWYSDLLSISPSPHAYKGYLHYLSQVNNYKRVLELYEAHKKTFKNDGDIQLIFAQALEATGRQQESDTLLIELAQNFKQHIKIALYAAQSLIRNAKFDDAITIINNYLNSTPKSPNNYIFHFLKSQAYSQKGENNKALASVKKSLKLYPEFDKGWLMYAALKEEAGHLEEAIKGYSSFIEHSPENSFQFKQHLISLTLKKKVLEQNTSLLLGSKSDLEQAIILFQHNQPETALEKVNKALAVLPNDQESNLLKIQILTSMHQYKEAAHSACTCIKQDPNNDTWYQALHLLCRSGLSLKHGINHLRDICKQHPDSLYAHMYTADLMCRHSQKEQAINHHIKASELCTDDELKKHIQYNLALIYYEQKKYDQLTKLLEQIITDTKEFLPAQNLYAYYLATKGKNVPKARKIISFVLKYAPKNPHYLDTLAVVLYKEKKYTKAHKLLQRLAQEEPNDATIMKNFAKVSFKLNKKNEARVALDKAIACAHIHEKKECDLLLKRWNL